jgi:hypothetical protein
MTNMINNILRTYYQFAACGGNKLAWLLLPVFFISCKKNFSSDQFTDDKLVVLAEITAGDTIKIPIGKTIKVGGGGIIRFEKVNDASVVFTEERAQSLILQPNWSSQFTANPTTMFTNRRRLKSNTTYSILIKHPTLGIVEASTHIPSLPKVSLIDTAYDTYYGKNLLAADITWQDDTNSENFYIIEAVKELLTLRRYFFYQGKRYDYDSPKGYALHVQLNSMPHIYRDTVSQNKFLHVQIFTGDNKTDNSTISTLDNPFRRIFLPDRSFQGLSYQTRVYMDPQFFTAADPKQKGRIRLQVKNASRELYDYLFLYEKYKTDFGFVPANQLPSPTGNISNGLGIFGGSSRKERIFYFDELL